MSTTIDSLDIQISSSAGNASANIDELAASLTKLKSSASLTKVTNNLAKLSTALNGLNGADGALNGLEKLSTTMGSLSGIQKLSGLSSALTTLKRLPEIMGSIDPSTVTAFSASMKELAGAMAPLATQIEKISAGFSKLPANLKAAVAATNQMSAASDKAAASQDKHNTSLNHGGINLMSYIYNAQAMVSSIQWLGQMFNNFMSDAIEWEGIQFRFGRAFGEDAEEVYNHVLMLNEALDINVQQFMQYSSLYGSLLKGFGLEQEKVTTMSVGLTELSYDIWAAYNDRYKSLEEASEAVRSAITGEIEPIRNAGIPLTEASMQEYLDSLGMAEIRMANLSEADKAQVRYATMVNAAMNQGIVGTYAQEIKTAEGAVRTLSQQTKSLKQAVGSLLLPALSAIIPVVSAVVSVLYRLAAAIAAVFKIPFFEVDWSSAANGAGSVADSAKKAESALGGAGGAAKKLRDYMMGFDELNVISPDTGGGGGGGGSGALDDLLDLPMDTLWGDMEKKVDEIEEKILGFFKKWKVAIGIVAGALGAITFATMLSKLGEAVGIGQKFLGVMGTIKKLATSAIVITIQFALQKELFGDFIDGKGFLKYIEALLVGGIGSFILYSMWGTGGLVIGLGVTAVAAISAALEDGSVDSVEEVTTLLTGMATAATGVAIAFKALKGTSVGAFFALLKEGNGLVPTLAAAFPTLSNAISTCAGWFSTAATAVGTFIGGLSAGVIAGIVAVIVALTSAVYFLAQNWDKVKVAAQNFFKTNIEPKLEKIKGHWEDIKKSLEPLAPLFEKVRKKLEPLIKKVQNFFKKIDVESVLSGIGKAFEVLGGIVFAILTGPVAGAFSAAVTAIEGFVQTVSGIIQVVSGVVSFVVALFQGDWQKVGQSVRDIGDGIKETFSGLYNTIVKPLEEFVTGVIDWFVSLYDELVGHSIVPDMIDEIVDWFLDMPGRILDTVGQFVEDTIGKFDELWEGIKNWFSGDKMNDGKTTVKVSLAKDGWTNLKTWIGEKVSVAVALLRDGWKNLKTWVGENVPVYISLLRDGWKNITSWVGDKVSVWISLLRSGWTDLKSWVGTKVSVFISLLRSGWSSISSWIGTSVSVGVSLLKSGWTTISKFVGTSVSVGISLVKNGWSSIKSWLGNLTYKLNFTLPKIGINWGTKKLFGWTINWPSSFYTYAQGGFPDMGEMFIAREAGPEMVGTIGNKNAVVNNDQIVEAVSQGVYRAVMSAMSSQTNGENNMNVNVFLDGKQITAAVERTQRERGTSIMGRQVYAY